MVDNTYFRVFSSLLTPEHQQRIGNALWVFLWMIDHTTKDETGAVYYANPVSYKQIGDDLGIDKSTVKRHCLVLAKAGYISMKYTTRGYKYHVMKSKKWGDVGVTNDTKGITYDTKGVTSDTDSVSNDTPINEKCVTDDTESVTSDTEGVKFGHSILQDNINNNLKDKEIKEKEQKETASDSLSFETMKNEILQEYVRLRASGFHTSPTDSRAADEIIQSGISLSDAKKYMQECFDQYQPKHKRDRINTLSYCVGYILDKHIQENAEMGQPAMDLTNEFLEGVKKIVPDLTEPNIKKWSADMQKLLDKGKTAERIKEIMTFARNDSFWSGHVMTPADLTMRFDKLALQAGTKAQPRKSNERKDQLPKWVEEDKQSNGAQSEKKPSNVQEEAALEFQDMLAELRARKQGGNQSESQRNASY